MKRKKPAVTALILAAAVSVTGCTPTKPDVIQEAAQSHSSFTLAELTDQAIDRAYVICEYSDTQHLANLGFERADLHSIDNNPHAWEADTGIGLIFEEETAPYVEWFSPQTIDACPGNLQSETEIDPDAPIGVHREERQSGTLTDVEVLVLDAPVR